MDDERDHVLLQEWDAVSMYEPSTPVENGKEKEWETFDPDAGSSEGTGDVQTDEFLETLFFFSANKGNSNLGSGSRDSGAGPDGEISSGKRGGLRGSGS